MTTRKWIFTGLGVLTVSAILAVIAWLYLVPDPVTDNAPHLKHFTAEEQTRKSQKIVDGLNTGDVMKVGVLRELSETDPKSVAATKAENDTVASALPAAGCHYTLKSVDDEGEQGEKIVPGLIKESQVYLLNLNVDEECQGRQSKSRTLGLYLVPYWGYWTPISFAS